MNRLLAKIGALFLALGPVVSACTGLDPELRSVLDLQDAEDGKQDLHVGPKVELTDAGPARFARTLYDGFHPQRALEFVRFIDHFYRAPANQGYDEVLTRLAQDLREIGFGGSEKRLQVEFLKVADIEQAWTPVSAKLVLRAEGEEPRVLHSFSKPEDVDRVMLPVNAPSCDLKAEVALRLDDVKKGMVLVTSVSAAQVTARAQSRGAAAVISASLYPFNEDPLGGQRHRDAIQFHTQALGQDMPTAQISPRSLEIIEETAERAAKRGAKVFLEFQAETLVEKRPLRTLMAVIEGDVHPDQAVVMVSHVQEPGACDNASGVAGLLEGARGLVEALREKKISWPDRSLVFLWGDEFRQSESWLASTKMTPLVGISSDMTGQSWEKTHAIALLERNPDPGAIKVLEPDFHTPWGAGQVSRDELKPNGFAVIARCAMADVSSLEGGTWKTGEHPWEGGSDHDIFIKRGIPAVLFWHFTDFTYHTSLDRMEFVDPDEMRRTGVALLSTALAVASAEPGDLDRYLKTNDREQALRTEKAMAFGDADMDKMWKKWCNGDSSPEGSCVRGWLINLCRGADEKLPRPK